MFGRAASYRFVDVPSDGRYNLALSQSQLDSAYLYEKWVTFGFFSSSPFTLVNFIFYLAFFKKQFSSIFISIISVI